MSQPIKWAAAMIPVYLVYVHLEQQEPVDWLEHEQISTTLHAHAHWVRVNGLSEGPVRVPLENRLTVATFAEWHRDLADLAAGFGMGVTA